MSSGNIQTLTNDMTNLITHVLVLNLLIIAPAFAQFEGLIDLKMDVADHDSTRQALYSMLVKKDMVSAKITAPGVEDQPGAFIFRGDKKLLWIVDDNSKQYVEIPLNDSGIQVPANLGGVKSGLQPKLQRTGRKQTLLGYECDEWLSVSESESTRIWGTEKLSSVFQGLAQSFGQLGSLTQEASAGWDAELTKMNLFPLKIVSSKDGKLLASQEVTKIEAREIAPKSFEPPTGYERQSLGVDVDKIMEQLKQEMEREDHSTDTSDRN